MIFLVLTMVVQFCTPQIYSDFYSIPIVSDEQGNLCFGDPFGQNETPQEQSPTNEQQLMDGELRSMDLFHKQDAELSPLYVPQPQAIKTPLTDQDIESLSASLYQPVYTFSYNDEVQQNIANPEAQHKIPSTPQLRDELPLPSHFYQEVEAEPSSLHVSQSQAIKTPLTDQKIESHSAELSQPVYTFMRGVDVHQNIGKSKSRGTPAESRSTPSQETMVMDTNIEKTDMDFGVLLEYGDLGPLSVGEIDVEPLSFHRGIKLLSNDTYQFESALMRDAKHQPNTSDPFALPQIPETSSDFTNEIVRNVRERNMACPTFSDPACRQSSGSVRPNSGQSFVQQDNFNQSFVNQTGKKSYYCDICKKHFRSSSHYEEHRRTHTGEKPFQCDICQKKFRTSSHYKEHRRTHTGEKPFQCDICKKQFCTSFNYRTHQRTHTGEKPFLCDICLKQFRTSSHYKEHRRTHTGEKPIQCDICNKEFSTPFNYRTHRLTHTGEKPFQCDICTKQFRTSSDYQKHRRIHTGEKPFQCDICSKQFRTSSDYQKHRRTHAGEKSHICYWCNQDYCSKRSLIKHVTRCSSRSVSRTADPVASCFISSNTRLWTYMQ